MSLSSHKQIITTAVQDLLTPYKFKKEALVFSRALSDVIQFVTLQSSSPRTARALKITVNLGVLVPSISETWSPSDVWSSQWRERLGNLMPEPSDRWWLVQSDREASVAAAEITVGLRLYGLPRLEALASKELLADLWRSGQSPGLTEVQRRRYLGKIENEHTA